MRKTDRQLYAVVGIWLTIGVLLIYALFACVKYVKREQMKIKADTVQVQAEFEDNWAQTIKNEDL